MNILFLGTSGHGITPNRKLTATLIDGHILLDCGEETVRSLYSNNIKMTDIRVVFLSHLHADHVLGLITLLWQMAYYDRIQESPIIYVPEGMKKNLQNLFDNCFSIFNSSTIIPNIQELPLHPSDPLHFIIENITYTVQWVQTKHTPLCYAYRFNDFITFSGDSAPSENIQTLALNCPYLVHEASFSDSNSQIAHQVNHSTPCDAATIAKNAKVHQLILTHLPHLKREEEGSFSAQASQIFPSIKLAHDGDEISQNKVKKPH